MLNISCYLIAFAREKSTHNNSGKNKEPKSRHGHSSKSRQINANGIHNLRSTFYFILEFKCQFFA